MYPNVIVINPDFVCAVNNCGNAIHEGQTVILDIDESRSLFLCSPCYSKIINMGGKI